MKLYELMLKPVERYVGDILDPRLTSQILPIYARRSLNFNNRWNSHWGSRFNHLVKDWDTAKNNT